MIKVQVSPFIGISEWKDSYSGITFSKKAGVIKIPDGLDLTGVKKHIRLNQLILIGGDLSEYKEAVKKQQESQPIATDKDEKAEEKTETLQKESLVTEEQQADEEAAKEEVKEEVKSEKLSNKQLKDMSVSKLKDKAKELNISGYSNMKKDTLIKAIKEVQ